MCIFTLMAILLFIHSVMSDSASPWTAACRTSLSITISQSLLKLMSIELVMPSSISSSVVPFPPTLSLSQHQGLFQWAGSLHQVAKVLELQLQHQSFHIQGWFPLGLSGLICLLSKGISRVVTNTTIQKHQFFGTQHSLWSNCHICTWLLEKPQFDYKDLCRQSNVSAF